MPAEQASLSVRSRADRELLSEHYRGCGDATTIAQWSVVPRDSFPGLSEGGVG